MRLNHSLIDSCICSNPYTGIPCFQPSGNVSPSESTLFGSTAVQFCAASWILRATGNPTLWQNLVSVANYTHKGSKDHLHPHLHPHPRDPEDLASSHFLLEFSTNPSTILDFPSIRHAIAMNLYSWDQMVCRSLLLPPPNQPDRYTSLHPTNSSHM